MCIEDRSIPRRSAGSTGLRGGGKSCTASARNRCGLRSSRSDSACALNGRAARSGTRRLGLRMPRGRPRGLPDLPLAKLSRARRAREAKRDQYQVLEILGHHLRKAGGSRRGQANRQQCRALAAFQKHSFGGKNQLYVLDTFWSRLLVSRRHKPLLLHVNAERLPQPPMVTCGGSPSCARCSSAIAAIPADRRKPGGSPRSGLSGPVVR